MAKTQMLLFAACAVSILSIGSCASLMSGFFGSPTLFRDSDLMGFAHPMMAPRSVLRSMQQMERVADGILSHMLEDNCNTATCAQKKNGTETEESGLSALRSLHMRPRFDLQETSEGVMLTAFTPGLRKEELNVEVVETDNVPVLIIAGESNSTVAKSDDQSEGTVAGMAIPFQAKYAKFERRIRIPHNVDRESVKADYQDGMLTVTMSRKALPAPQKQRVLIH